MNLKPSVRSTLGLSLALLVPVVQKVREAASHTQASCDANRDVNACSTGKLSSLVLASDDGHNSALSLLELYTKGSAMTSRQARLTLSKTRDEGSAERTDAMRNALAKGLVAKISAARMPASITTPMSRLINPASY